MSQKPLPQDERQDATLPEPGGLKFIRAFIFILKRILPWLREKRAQRRARRVFQERHADLADIVGALRTRLLGDCVYSLYPLVEDVVLKPGSAQRPESQAGMIVMVTAYLSSLQNRASYLENSLAILGKRPDSRAIRNFLIELRSTLREVQKVAKMCKDIISSGGKATAHPKLEENLRMFIEKFNSLLREFGEVHQKCARYMPNLGGFHFEMLSL